MQRPRPTGDEGFTLLEMVIAMLVMSVSVVGLVGALASMLQLSGEHRGHAVAETTAHSFSQAVMARGQYSETLTAAAGAGATSLSLRSASLLKAGDYLAVELETVRVASVASATQVTLSSATTLAHGSGARVTLLLRCPAASDLTPPSTSYVTTTGISAPTVTAVDYWDYAGSTWVSTSSSACGTAYDAVCTSGQRLAECESGLYRATLSIATTGDSRLRGISTTTSVLVRKGGS